MCALRGRLGGAAGWAHCGAGQRPAILPQNGLLAASLLPSWEVSSCCAPLAHHLAPKRCPQARWTAALRPWSTAQPLMWRRVPSSTASPPRPTAAPTRSSCTTATLRECKPCCPRRLPCRRPYSAAAGLNPADLSAHWAPTPAAGMPEATPRSGMPGYTSSRSWRPGCRTW